MHEILKPVFWEKYFKIASAEFANIIERVNSEVFYLFSKLYLMKW